MERCEASGVARGIRGVTPSQRTDDVAFGELHTIGPVRDGPVGPIRTGGVREGWVTRVEPTQTRFGGDHMSEVAIIWISVAVICCALCTYGIVTAVRRSKERKLRDGRNAPALTPR